MADSEDFFQKFKLSFEQGVNADMIIAFDGDTPICVKDRYSAFKRAGFYRTFEALEDLLFKAKADDMAVLITLAPSRKNK